MNTQATTQFLSRNAGDIAFDVTGDGPLVVCIPGMGDLRSSYRHAVPVLVRAGFRVATMDLRGHGESSVDFASYDDLALAGDIVALIEHLGGPAVVLGNSMGGAGALRAAADRPDLVSALVLLDPFARGAASAVMAMAMRVALVRPWGPSMWASYFTSLSPTGGPADRNEHEAAVRAALARPGRWRAFQQTARTDHRVAERALPSVGAPTLIVMGTKDRDFPDPAAEAAWLASTLNENQASATVHMVEGVGHYPMAEAADEVMPVIVEFVGRAVSNRG